MSDQQHAHNIARARVLAQHEPRASYCWRCAGWVRWAVVTVDAETLALEATLRCGHTGVVHGLKVVET